MVGSSEMESAMRRIVAACLIAMGGMLAGAPAQAYLKVPPFKGNDTGGIIAYTLAMQADARQLAVDHCARYGKVVKFLGVQPNSAATFPLPAVGCPMAPPSGRCARFTERAAACFPAGHVFATPSVCSLRAKTIAWKNSAGAARMRRLLLVSCSAVGLLALLPVCGRCRGVADAQGRAVGNEGAARPAHRCPK